MQNANRTLLNLEEFLTELILVIAPAACPSAITEFPDGDQRQGKGLMTRPKLVVLNTDLDEHPRSFWQGRGYRFDLSRNRLILYALSFVLSLSKN
jgi:hypothetical protein